MDMNQLTEMVRSALNSAQTKALRQGHQQVDVEHVLAVLLEQERGLAGSILNKAGVQVAGLQQQLGEELNRLPKVSGPSTSPDQVYITPRLNLLLSKAEEEAGKLKDQYLSVEHLLLVMADDKGAAGRLLRESGLSRESLMQTLREVRGSQRVTSPNPETTYAALEQYGRDLTAEASQGKLDPVIGRDDEIRRLMQVMHSRTASVP